MFLPRSFGVTGYEERVVRGDGAWSVLHRPVAPSSRVPAWHPSERGPRPPVCCTPVDGAITRRAFAVTSVPEGDCALDARLPLLFNDDVVVSLVRAKASTSRVHADHDGDALVCVIEGGATLESAFGPLRVNAAEHVWVPRGVAHRWSVNRGGLRALVIEARGEMRAPAGYANARGQLLPHAPYGERDFRAPAWAPSTQRPTGAREAVQASCKRGGRRHDAELADDPLTVVGWDGVVYPVALPWEVPSSRGYAKERARLFEHDGFTLTTHVTREDAAPPPAGDDLVTLAVDGDGDAIVVFEPGCVPPRAVGVLGGITVTLHARRPLEMTPNGVMLAG